MGGGVRRRRGWAVADGVVWVWESWWGGRRRCSPVRMSGGLNRLLWCDSNWLRVWVKKWVGEVGGLGVVLGWF